MAMSVDRVEHSNGPCQNSSIVDLGHFSGYAFLLQTTLRFPYKFCRVSIRMVILDDYRDVETFFWGVSECAGKSEIRCGFN